MPPPGTRMKPSALIKAALMTAVTMGAVFAFAAALHSRGSDGGPAASQIEAPAAATGAADVSADGSGAISNTALVSSQPGDDSGDDDSGLEDD